MGKAKGRRAAPNQLRMLRLQIRMSQYEVAAHLGISQTRYWQIENSYTEATDREREKLVRLMGVTEAEAFPYSEVVIAS